MKLIIVMVLALWSSAVSAAERPSALHSEIGVGIAYESYYLAQGFSLPLGSIFRHKVQFGGVIDPSDEYGDQSTLFGSYQLGLNIELSSKLYFGGYVGPGFISNTHHRLSTGLEFFSEGYVGLKFAKVSPYVSFRHISNAHIKGPNLGRNSLNLGLTVDF